MVAQCKEQVNIAKQMAAYYVSTGSRASTLCFEYGISH